jgi:GT2 family glycosyltransferase
MNASECPAAGHGVSATDLPAMRVRALYIVLAVHNRMALTRRFLRSLEKQSVQGFTTVVVDDGSDDGTREMLAKEFPRAVRLAGDGTLWWAASMNLGVEHALRHGAAYILTMNDDTVAPHDFVRTMLEGLDGDACNLVGATECDAETGEVVYGGERINWAIAGYSGSRGRLLAQHSKDLWEETHHPGRGLLVPAEVFEVVGVYDADAFPQNVADYDFTLRARAVGYRVFCHHGARLLTWPKESKAGRLQTEFSWANYRKHLFSNYGAANLRHFLQFGWRHCPRMYLPTFVAIGLVRCVFGYPLMWTYAAIMNRLRGAVGGAKPR